jgi:dehydrogenase/reductase SDR family member 12
MRDPLTPDALARDRRPRDAAAMTQYATVIPCAWTVERAFRYMSDFSNAQYWDPSVRAARRVDDDEIRVGSPFELTVRFAGRDKILRYEVTELEDAHRVVFTSSTGSLLSQDTLTFEPRSGGCEMTYRAELRPRGLAVLTSPFLAVMFRRLANRASVSLQRVLSGSGEPPS